MARRSVKGIGIQPLMPAYDAPFTDRTRQGAQNYFQNMDQDKEEKTKQEDNSGVRHARHLTIQGETPDPEQKKNMELIITTAQEVDGSNDLSVMSCIVAVIQESAAKNLKGGDGSS